MCTLKKQDYTVRLCGNGWYMVEFIQILPGTKETISWD